MIPIFLCKGDAYVHSTAKDSREHRSKYKGEDAVKCLCTRHKLTIRQTENDPRFNQNDHEFRKWLCCWQDDSALIYKVWGESLNGLIRHWCEVFYITKQPSQLPSLSPVEHPREDLVRQRSPLSSLKDQELEERCFCPQSALAETRYCSCTMWCPS